MIRIATIVTCFNRKQKTLSCLRHFYEAINYYNQSNPSPICITVFLTDDGCTDGTAEAVSSTFSDKDIRILQGTGSLFWAGGMRLAWQASIDTGILWDAFLLLNDDTIIYPNVFNELFEADEWGCQQTGRHGMVSGITCQPECTEDVTYGGRKFVGKFKGRRQLARPTGKPQFVDTTHANILLIHHDLVDRYGIFYKGFVHGAADEDYSMMANRHSFPVMVTSHVCGECKFDHDSEKDEIFKLMNMTLVERRQYVNSPTHSDHDYLLFVSRNMPFRYPFAWLLRTIRLYYPKFYYHVTKIRGVYKS